MMHLALILRRKLLGMPLELQEISSSNTHFTAISNSEVDEASKVSIDVETASPSPLEQNDAVKEDFFVMYLNKLKGPSGKSPNRSDLIEILFTSVLAFIGILLVSVTGFWYLGKEFTSQNGTAVSFISGAYAATSVLVYDQRLLVAPAAQPRNVIGGYVVSSFIGVVTRIICGYIGLERWTTAAFAVMFSLIFMSLTKTIHPPGGACALIAIIGGPGVWDLGFAYVLTSMGAAFIMVMVAWLGNNLMPGRQYPTYWW